MSIEELNDLLGRQYTLQRKILASWEQLHRAKRAHSSLLDELHNIKEQIKHSGEPSLYDEMFGIDN